MSLRVRQVDQLRPNNSGGCSGFVIGQHFLLLRMGSVGGASSFVEPVDVS